ncbi:hypothetical protein BDW59DRAFT_153431 [Aspergillus cavernicola]|uniref:Cell wall proline rich protein n=1 Tax=Aspergillus cavernicola TaxID=176166 RepID=A0ABR4HL39_9EURO
MYDLTYMNQPSLPRHYDSEEEDISESETGHTFSPIDPSKTPGTLDSEMSAEESMDRPAFLRLLSPFPSTKGSRPGSMISMDTVKRSSTATFVTDSYAIFDQDDDMIIELPSPNSTSPLQSPIFLQPAVYVPSEPLSSPRSSFRSSSSSLHSDDESDIYVAEQVTYVEPLAKPNLILISPTTDQSSPRGPDSPETSDGSVYSCDEASKSQPILGETSMGRGRSRYSTQLTHSKAQGSLSALDTLRHCSPARPSISEPVSASAVEAPREMSFRARSMSFSRPQTPIAERSRRLQKEPPPPRPPSVQSTSTFSLFPTQSSSYTEESRSRSMSCSQSIASSDYSASSSQPTSRTASPSPYYSNSYNRSRSGSLYSISSMSGSPAKRPPLPYRSSIIKGSSMLGYSSSSLRSELEKGPTEHPELEDTKPKSKRKKSLKHLRPSITKSESSESSKKSFVDFMLRSKRKSMIKNV